MRLTLFAGLAVLLWLPYQSPAAGKERVIASVLPSLEYGPGCWSSIDLENLGDRAVEVEIEAHRASGALVALVDHPRSPVILPAGARVSFRLEIGEESGSGWARVREHVPAELPGVVAVSGHSECVVANKLRTSAREVAFALRNPAFSSDIEELRGDVVSMVNTSERAAQVSLCYSEGNTYSVAGRAFTEICSGAFDLQVPPFGTRRFPLEHEGSSHFSIKTRGDGIILQMLKPMGSGVKTFAVDSSIKFEEIK
jgi:hypothetical protein